MKPALVVLLSVLPHGPLAAASEPMRDREALELFRALFHQHPAHASTAAHGRCATLALSAMQAFLRSHPVSPELKATILAVVTEPTKPAFPKTIESAHFTIRYTDSDPTPSHRIARSSLEDGLTGALVYKLPGEKSSA